MPAIYESDTERALYNTAISNKTLIWLSFIMKTCERRENLFRRYRDNEIILLDALLCCFATLPRNYRAIRTHCFVSAT